VQHDEAAAFYVDMIDQMTVGNAYLLQEFNYIPTVAWQLDPFGHSSTNAALFSPMNGFDGLFVGRIDYQDLAHRIETKALETIWQPSPTYGSSVQIFTNIDFTGHYGPPVELCFDMRCEHQRPVQDDPNIEGYDIPRLVDRFVRAAYTWSVGYQGNDIMFKMGSDFNYQAARFWYKQLDKLIQYVNEDGRVNTFYSTPMEYLQAKFSENLTYPLKVDDFMPYASQPHAYWTGYYTSRPAHKYYIRMTSAQLQAARQLDLLNQGNGSSVEGLLEAVALNQHHDSVTGTEKQHVCYDYARQLATAMNNTDLSISAALASQYQDSKLVWTQCHRINETVCSFTTNSTSFAISLYNSMAMNRTEYIKIPISTVAVVVLDSTGKPVPAQIVATGPSPIPISSDGPPAPYTLWFEASLPSMGYNTYFVQPTTLEEEIVDNAKQDLEFGQKPMLESPEADIILQNSALQVNFFSNNGSLKSILNKQSGIISQITQGFYWYHSYVAELGTESVQTSGAYIFRPKGETPNPIANAQSTFQYMNGTNYQEIRQFITPWLNNTFRLYNDADWLESHFTIGPIPIEDKEGKEVISRYTTDIVSNSMYYTDTNGREILMRKRNYRESWNLTVHEPVAGNYYPVGNSLFINDTTRQFTLLPDRSEGGASINDGQIELMVHRRILVDDGKGVGEPLNETISITPYPDPVRIGPGLTVRYVHRIRLDYTPQAASYWRPLAQRIYRQPLVAFTPIPAGAVSQWVNAHRVFRVGATVLPANVELLSLYATGPATGILRLAQTFGIGEDATLSQPVSVNLATLFTAINLLTVQELTLTANQVMATAMKKRGLVGTQMNDDYMEYSAPSPPGVIVLNPLQIRTFQITYQVLP